MSKIWDMASWRQHTYRNPQRTVHGPVGVQPDPLFRGDARNDAHLACGHHVCSCKTASEPKVTGAKPDCHCAVAHVGPCPNPRVERTPCAGCASIVAICGDSPMLLACANAGCLNCMDVPTIGTFAWLKTLPPETMVRRGCWMDRGSRETVSAVLREVERKAGRHDPWRDAADWQLAEEAKPATLGSQHINMRVRLKSNHEYEGVFGGVLVGADHASTRAAVRWDTIGHGDPLMSAIELVPEHRAEEAKPAPIDSEVTVFTLGNSVLAGDLVTLCRGCGKAWGGASLHGCNGWGGLQKPTLGVATGNAKTGESWSP